jgi:hypothetical protein
MNDSTQVNFDDDTLYAYASSQTSHDRRPQLHLPRLSVTTAINVKMIISSAQLLTLIES